MAVKLYHTYTQFPHNVRLSPRRIVTFSADRDFFKFLRLINTLTYLLMSFMLFLLWQFYENNTCELELKFLLEGLEYAIKITMKAYIITKVLLTSYPL